MEIDMSKYRHKKVWDKNGEYFCVEVVLWGTEYGRNMWNIYCCIYPQHKLFDELRNEYDMNDHFHGGCTYYQWYYGEGGELLSKKYGCDYVHCTDERFSKMKTPEEAEEVFRDAENLFTYLSNKGSE